MDGLVVEAHQLGGLECHDRIGLAVIAGELDFVSITREALHDGAHLSADEANGRNVFGERDLRKQWNLRHRPSHFSSTQQLIRRGIRSGGDTIQALRSPRTTARDGGNRRDLVAYLLLVNCEHTQEVQATPTQPHPPAPRYYRLELLLKN